MTTIFEPMASSLTDDQLLSRVKTLTCAERQATAQLIAALAELDCRKLFLAEGFPSLFAYCTQVLHLSEHAAYGRIEAVRAVHRFPVVLEHLADGAATLTTICLLAPLLTRENHQALLVAARHKSRREVEHLVAETRPKPDVLAAVTQLAPERYKIQFTASREMHDKLRRAQALLRHVIPNGDPAAVFERALDVLLAGLERTKLAATSRPRAMRAAASGSRHIPAAVRREVWRRDGARCAFVGAAGRCPERGFLELHHVRPFAAGGEASAVNIELRCRAHNAYESEQYFGPFVLREEAAEYSSVRTEFSVGTALVPPASDRSTDGELGPFGPGPSRAP